MHDLGELIHKRNAGYSRRYSRALLDELVHVGDPVADAAILAIDERAYNPDGGQIDQLRALAKEGDERALAFFERAEEKPAWLDPRLLETGQKLALAYTRHYGLSLTHSLFAGALFARATLVTGSTGRLGSNPARRIQETGAFIAAILQPNGLTAGAIGFETTLRVRLLHSSIRSWLGRSPGFADAYYGVPIDQTMLAMTLGLFDYLNLRSLVRLGLPLSDDDIRGHHHMWKYVGYLLGIDERLLTDNVDQERELWSALVAHQTFPELFGENYLHRAIAMVDQLLMADGWAEGTLRSLFLYLSGHAWFGVPKSNVRDPRVDALWWVGRSLGSMRSFVPFASGIMESEGAARFAEAERMAHSHGFGVKVEIDESDEEQEVGWQAMAAGVRARFAARERASAGHGTVGAAH